MQTSAVRLSHRAPDIASCAALALAAALLAGCNSSSAPSVPIWSLDFEVSTSEWEPERKLLVVGESGWVSVSTTTRECFFGGECSASVDVEIRSTNPAAVAPAQRRVRTPARVAIVAHSPGTAVISASVASLSREKQVDVVAAPLPVDSILIRCASWCLVDSTLATVHDETGQLVQLTLPVMGDAALVTTIFRSQVEVHMPSWSITSSNSGVAWVGCGAGVDGPDCHSFTGWVTGVAPGDATVTITARNLQRSFAVTVK